MALKDFDFDTALKSLIELVVNNLQKDNEETEVNQIFSSQINSDVWPSFAFYQSITSTGWPVSRQRPSNG